MWNRRSRMTSCFTCLLLLSVLLLQVQAEEAAPIRIGATVSLEGPYKEPSFMIQAAFKLWAKGVNEKGGLLGRPVRLILYDDKSQQDLVRSLYEKLITEDRVDLLFSPYSATLTLAATEITERHGFVVLACGAAGEEVWTRGYKFVFGNYAPAGRYFIGFLDLIARQGMKTVAVINENSAFNVAAGRGAREWAESFRLKTILSKGYKDGKTELPGLVNEVVGINPDAVILSAYPPDGYEFLRLMKAANYRPRAIALTVSAALPDFGEKAGETGEGVFGPSQWEPNESIPFPGTRKFVDEFRVFSGMQPSYHAASAYAACQIIERAVDQTKSLNQDGIRAFILSLDTVTVMGRFKVDHTGMQIGHNPLLIQWQDGKKQIVYPSRMQTAPPRF